MSPLQSHTTLNQGGRDTTANAVAIYRIVRREVTTFAVITVPARLVKAL